MTTKYFEGLSQRKNETEVQQSTLTPRLRTIKQAMDEIKELDPKTALTIYHIRTRCETGKIKCEKVGRKIFVNFDSLLDYLNMGVR